MRVNPISAIPPLRHAPAKFAAYTPAGTIWCSQCRTMRPRRDSVQSVSADGLRYRMVCAACSVVAQ